jgi:transposase
LVIIGVDPHPATHTAFAIEANSAKPLADISVQNSEEGILGLMEWAKAFEERHWAIEGASNPFAAPLVGALLAENEPITDIPPSLTSQYRSRRSEKKTDRFDARNAAMALLANLDDLPAYAPHPQQRRLQVLTRTRSRVVGELKANRMALEQMVREGCEKEERMILEDLIACLKEQLERLGAVLEGLVKQIMPEILKLRGVGVVLGATIMAEVGDIGRFEKESKFSSYCGAAPVDRSSGSHQRARVNTQGNRRMNYVLHMMAQVRLRTDGGRSRELLERKEREGKSKRGALRVLKTYIARELYSELKAINESRKLALVSA